MWIFCDTPTPPRTVAHQAPLYMGFSTQEYWSRLSFPCRGSKVTLFWRPTGIYIMITTIIIAFWLFKHVRQDAKPFTHFTLFATLSFIVTYFIYVFLLSCFSHVWLCMTLCHPMDSSARLLCPWDSPGKNTGMDCYALLQGIFPTQGSNLHFLGLLRWQMGSLPLAPPGRPWTCLLSIIIPIEHGAPQLVNCRTM